ncbi:hypothetical protein J6590_055162 [Homalodisca vitripennis]|nr:hypothetical protein J6590_055162 [Homalodisca vitripennis]
MKTIEGKVVVLGAQGVGKTSMVVRYIGKMFSHHISPTIGASFFTCKINIEDTRIKLQVRRNLLGLITSISPSALDRDSGKSCTELDLGTGPVEHCLQWDALNENS